MVEYDGVDGFKSEPYESDYTIREIIQRALCTISSLQTREDHKPTAILIGTHFEKSEKENFLTKANSVQALFDNYRDTSLVPVSKEGGKWRFIYFLNNVSGDSSDIDELRVLIKKTVERRFLEVEIDTPYLLLHLFLRMKYEKRGWCKLEDCKEVAKSCGISGDDLFEALKYLHDRFGTVLYYRDLPKLKERVIVNVKLIMELPAKIIGTVFGTKNTDPKETEHIQMTGEVPKYLINMTHKSSKLDNGIPTDEILELLEHRHILYTYTNSETKEVIHFMPCLLKPDPSVNKESSNHEFLSNLTYSPLLLIPLSCDFVPLGLFQALVVKCSKTWYLDESKQYRHRNRIRFYFTSLHVEIRSLASHLEVRILNGNTDNQSLIAKFRYELWKLLDEVNKAHTIVHWTLGFYCPHGLEQSDIPPHSAKLLGKEINKVEVYEGSTNISVTCSTSRCIQSAIALKDKHKCWFMVSVCV